MFVILWLKQVRDISSELLASYITQTLIKELRISIMNIRVVLNNTPISVRDIYPSVCMCVCEVYERGRLRTCDAAGRLDYSDFSVVSNEFHPASGRG